MPHSNSNLKELRFACEANLRTLYLGTSQHEASLRLTHELQLIEAGSHVQLFLQAGKMGEAAREHGIFCQASEGAACSLVNYLLKLSDIDPLRYGLPIERYLTPRRQEISLVIAPKGIKLLARLASRLNIPGRKIELKKASPLQMLLFEFKNYVRQHEGGTQELAEIPSFDLRTADCLNQGDLPDVLKQGCLEEALEKARESIQIRGALDLATLTAAAVKGIAHSKWYFNFLAQASGDRTTWEFPGPVAEIVRPTWGVIVFQEQVMQVLHAVAGTPFSEAYSFLLNVGKRKYEAIREFQKTMVRRALDRGLSSIEATRLSKEVTKAADGAPCQARNLSDAMTTWQTLYLRLRFPKQFDLLVKQFLATVQ